MPEARGSSVPAWPAFSARNNHLTLATASVDPMPTGLSSTSQPETGRPFFLPRRAISSRLRERSRHRGTCRRAARAISSTQNAEGATGQRPPLSCRTSPPQGGRTTDSPTAPSSFLIFLIEVARHLGRAQQFVDPGHVVVARIQPEPEFRHVFHLPQR